MEFVRTQDRCKTAFEAMSLVQSGHHVYVGSNCGQPVSLTDALCEHADRLRDVKIYHLITFGSAPYCDLRYAESFRHKAFFIGPNTRAAADAGRVDVIPGSLSEIPRWFEEGIVPLDVALVQVSEPDSNGMVSLGVSVDLGWSAVHAARIKIAEVNPHCPRTHGACQVPLSLFDAWVPSDRPLIEHPGAPATPVSSQIGAYIADLIQDGCTVQTGIGSIPSALIPALSEKNDLGIHTELLGSAWLPLIESGVVTGAKKGLHRGLVVASFCIGTEALYRHLHDNPLYHFAPTSYVNDSKIIAAHDNMVSINGALQIDLTGQVVADSIGSRLYSGVGGQLDFVRGATLSRGGMSVIALPSTAKGGTISRIVPTLAEGAGVVTPRSDVHYVATEFGTANLKGKTITERAERLIEIAHPDFRESLREQAKRLMIIRP